MSAAAQISLQLPDLLMCIAHQIPRQSDISSFSRCSTLLYSLIQPFLFRDILVFLNELPAIVTQLKSNGALASRCRSLTIEATGRDLPDEDGYPEEDYHIWCEHLVLLLQILGDKSRLRRFAWFSDHRPGELFPDVLKCTKVWATLQASGNSLQELDITTFDWRWNWETGSPPPLPTWNYPHLQVLHLNMRDALGWDLSGLQNMLHSTQNLQDLALLLPVSHGPSGLDFSSNHPRLRSFETAYGGLPSTSASFLRRHPTIESLMIEVQDDLMLCTKDLPILKAFHTDDLEKFTRVGLFTPISKRPIIYLSIMETARLHWLPSIECILPGLSVQLRCLDLGGSVDGFRSSLEELETIIRLFPGLVELAIVISYISDEVSSDADDVRKLLHCARDSSLLALRFCEHDSKPLPSSFLEDLGLVPSQLRYLAWGELGSHGHITYRLERRDGKTRAFETVHPRKYTRASDWTGCSIFDHLNQEYPLEI